MSPVMGNIYVFLLAGHDTTAHTLAFALTLLAIYPEIQRKAVDHIEAVLSPGVDPVSVRVSEKVHRCIG